METRHECTYSLHPTSGLAQLKGENGYWSEFRIEGSCGRTCTILPPIASNISLHSSDPAPIGVVERTPSFSAELGLPILRADRIQRVGGTYHQLAGTAEQRSRVDGNTLINGGLHGKGFRPWLHGRFKTMHTHTLVIYTLYVSSSPAAARRLRVSQSDATTADLLFSASLLASARSPECWRAKTDRGGECIREMGRRRYAQKRRRTGKQTSKNPRRS
jgi:hypothetical protein